MAKRNGHCIVTGLGSHFFTDKATALTWADAFRCAFPGSVCFYSHCGPMKVNVPKDYSRLRAARRMLKRSWC